ncbi:MAG: hypothetical protein JZU53_06845 [Paludibacter sp.]|nr:hypothetical protein [Paludibacter sp.]
MNRIILIGNGFDLAHGLPTRYEDFINDYWNGFIMACANQDIFNISGQYNSDCIALDIPERGLTLSHFLPVGNDPLSIPNKGSISYNQLEQELNEFNERYRYPESRIKLSIENDFLLHLLKTTYQNKEWVDVENEYYRFLSYYLNPKEHDGYEYGPVDILNKDFDVIKTELENYLDSVLSKSRISASKPIKDIIYSHFNLKDFIEKGREIIVEEEEKKIDQYFDDNVDPDNYRISKKTIPWIEQYRTQYEHGYLELIDHLSNKKVADKYFDLQPDNILFLNFNYTNLEKLYSKHKGLKSEVIHIHGELKAKDNSMIFGYGDELEENYRALENLKDNAYLENIKSMQYLESDNYKRLLSFIQSSEYQIIILGHSCGNSDRTLLNTLFEHKNCVSIKPYYYRYKDKTTGEIKDNYSDIVRNISRNFTDKKSMRDKVVNKTFTDWFSEDLKDK